MPQGDRVETGIDLVPACETMALLTLSSSPADMRARFGKMTVAMDKDGKPVTAEDLEVAGAMMVLMRDAVNPSLLGTLGSFGAGGVDSVLRCRSRPNGRIFSKMMLPTIA